MSTDVPPSLNVDQLPDDPALLKRIIAERDAQLARAEADKQAAVQEAVKAAVQAAIAATMAALLKRFYAPRTRRSIRGNCSCSASASTNCLWMNGASPRKPAKDS